MAEQSNSGERRSTPRHPIQIPIEVTVGSEMLIQVTANLSSRGAFFNKAIPYAVGTHAKLRLLLPGEPAIKCEGEVANIPNKADYGMGMRFTTIAPEDEKRIEQFAERCREDQEALLGF
jgi:hypothetical protein